VVDLAHRFGLTAVAEGIETDEDRAVLTEMGYDMGQGFLFAKPMKSTEFATMLMSCGAAVPNWPR
jgi:EAL domain-containing protein (putative c-di-GMP-specific phosphodiesterase class I)